MCVLLVLLQNLQIPISEIFCVLTLANSIPGGSKKCREDCAVVGRFHIADLHWFVASTLFLHISSSLFIIAYDLSKKAFGNTSDYLVIIVKYIRGFPTFKRIHSTYVNHTNDRRVSKQSYYFRIYYKWAYFLLKKSCLLVHTYSTSASIFFLNRSGNIRTSRAMLRYAYSKLQLLRS